MMKQLGKIAVYCCPGFLFLGPALISLDICKGLTGTLGGILFGLGANRCSAFIRQNMAIQATRKQRAEGQLLTFDIRVLTAGPSSVKS
jgi:hypothetical protein